MSRGSGAVSRPRRAWILCSLAVLVGCSELGNPPQFATGPTVDPRGHLETTTRSFRNEKTIRRIVGEGLGDFDYADPSIGPSETLTLVSVVVRWPGIVGGPPVQLVTIFEMAGQPPIVRRWSASGSSRRWSAAFAMPEPPKDAVTSVGP